MGGVTEALTIPSPQVRDAWTVFTRARLGADVARGPVRMVMLAQDARVWGASWPSAIATSGAGSLSLFEGFGEVHTQGARPSFVRMGRQRVAWGEGRLLGSAEMSPVGRAFDAVRGRLTWRAFDFEALGALLDASRPAGVPFAETSGPGRDGGQLFGALAAWGLDPLLRLELYGLARFTSGGFASIDGRGPSPASANADLFTTALRVSGEGQGFSYGAEGAFQFGTTRSLARGSTDIEAFALAGHVGRTFEELIGTPTLRLGGSFASGDDMASGKYRQFDPLFPDPSAWHGAMNLFAWSNQLEGNARVSAIPWTDTVLALEYRFARLAETRGAWVGSYLNTIGRAETDSADLGHEWDASFRYRPWQPVEFMAGYSYLRLGTAARHILGFMQRGEPQPQGTFIVTRNAHLGLLQVSITLP